MEVAGVDGCPGGWLVVRALVSERLRVLSINVQPDFTQVLSRADECATIAIDIPIGLSEDGRREPETEARRVLSPLRHSSVFPAPVRAVLGAGSYREACAISAGARRDGKKVSKQTYFLTDKIADVDRVMSGDPSLQARVIEVHPEVCFWALSGHQLLRNYKKTPAGRVERAQLLSSVFADDLASLHPPAGTARHDLYDACAAAWTAARHARGEAERLPPEPRLDSHGLRMEIVY